MPKERENNTAPMDENQPLPRAEFPGAVNLIETPEAFAEVLPRIKSAGELGFDTESRPSFQKHQHFDVALVQFATATQAWLIRTNKLGMHPMLKELLEDPSLRKVGLSLKDDRHRLLKLGNFSPAGFVDLQPLARAIGLQEQSVRKLAARTLGLQVSKSAQLTNWEAETLTRKQLLYAATDAWVTLMIYRSETFRNYLEGGGVPLPLPTGIE